MKSDTPETDANAIHRTGQLRTAVVDLEFARKLERERDKARKLLAAANESLNAIHVEIGGWIRVMMEGGK